MRAMLVILIAWHGRDAAFMLIAVNDKPRTTQFQAYRLHVGQMTVAWLASRQR
jgi:hypothetical protein